MAPPYRQYVEEIHKATGYWPTWFPGTPLTLGTVGVIEDLVFVPHSHLSKFGISFETELDPNTQQIDHASKGAVEIKFKAKGEPSTALKYIANAEAGIGIDFNRENAIVFGVRDGVEHRIADVDKLKRELLALPRGRWPYDYAVITHLVHAKSGTALISSSNKAHVEISAKANLGNDILEIANAEAGLSFAYSRGLASKLLAEEGLTPLFRALRVQRKFWPWFLIGRSEDEPVPLGEPQFDNQISVEEERRAQEVLGGGN